MVEVQANFGLPAFLLVQNGETVEIQALTRFAASMVQIFDLRVSLTIQTPLWGIPEVLY